MARREEPGESPASTRAYRRARHSGWCPESSMSCPNGGGKSGRGKPRPYDSAHGDLIQESSFGRERNLLVAGRFLRSRGFAAGGELHQAS